MARTSMCVIWVFGMVVLMPISGETRHSHTRHESIPRKKQKRKKR